MLIEFHLKVTRDQQSNYTNPFWKFLPTHSQKTLTDLNKLFQQLISEPLFSYTLKIEIHFFEFTFVNV